uniref:Uncharacterized protein n=1 Tax=Plectus sambesii TaxID=2011161 RepID=A0A914XKD6_9BILA
MFADHPPKPVQNRLLQRHTDTRAYLLHRDKVMNIKSTIDNRPPPIYPHIQLKSKKMQTENERLGRVDAENQRLLRSILRISERKSNIDTRAPNSIAASSSNKYNRNQPNRKEAEHERLIRHLVSEQSSLNIYALDSNVLEEEALRSQSQQRH